MIFFVSMLMLFMIVLTFIPVSVIMVMMCMSAVFRIFSHIHQKLRRPGLGVFTPGVMLKQFLNFGECILKEIIS